MQISCDFKIFLGGESSPKNLERMTRLIKSKSEMHNTWWIVPVGNIGRIKAKATAKKRSRTITIDGIPSKFHAIAYKYIDEKRTCWGVMIVMMMTNNQSHARKKP